MDCVRLPKLRDDIGKFLLLRGEYAWLGFGFVSCHNDTNYTLPALARQDYGRPLGNCSALPGSPGVFTRHWTKAIVEVDCAKGTSDIRMVERGAGAARIVTA